jgi:prepilin-type processing-associated H-X9-DG protein
MGNVLFADFHVGNYEEIDRSMVLFPDTQVYTYGEGDSQRLAEALFGKNSSDEITPRWISSSTSTWGKTIEKRTATETRTLDATNMKTLQQSIKR